MFQREVLMQSFQNTGCPKVKVKYVPDSYPKIDTYFADKTSQHTSLNTKQKKTNNFRASFVL
jgi:cytochrome c551/c552